VAPIFGEKEIKYLEEGDAVATQSTGDLLTFTLNKLSGRSVGIGLEFGTLTPFEVLDALIADNWMVRCRQKGHPDGQYVTKVRRAFVPDDKSWRESVWRRAVEVNRAVFNWLERSIGP
jgi:hypothetical protein